MKLKNIALGIGFLAAMFSCSMEDDIASDTKGKVDGVSEDLYAALQFNISTGTDLSTKATTEVTGPAVDSDYSAVKNKEMEVNHCFVFVANGDEIIGRRYYTKSDLTQKDGAYKYTLNKHLLVKVPSVKPDLTVFVVGMTDDSNSYFATHIYETVFSLSELRNKPIGKFVRDGQETGNSLTDFIKVGEGAILAGSYGTSSKTTDFDCLEEGTVKCGVADVTLALRTAAIEIASFVIKDANDNVLFDSDNPHSAADVRAVLRDIQLGTDKGGIGQTDNNGQLLSTLLGGGEAIGAAYYAYTSYLNKWNSMNEEAKKKSNPIGYRFYTYEKKSSATNVTLTYDWKGRSGSTTFSIKTGGTTENCAEVKPNHLYKVHVTIKNQVVDVDVITYTMDWKKEEISGEFERING